MGEIPYIPVMTPGRELFERWLAAQDISPDDCWDYLGDLDRAAWEMFRISLDRKPICSD